jgi:actin-related protein
MEAVDAAPAPLRAALLSNIVLVGGNVKFPGIVERL